MDYFEQIRFESLDRSFLDPYPRRMKKQKHDPDFEYDSMREDELLDLEHESRREDEILGVDT